MFFFSSEKTPINSSSKAIGNGVSSQSLAISCHWPCLMGCSMECNCKSESTFSFSKASFWENAPLASTRNSTSEAENSFRIDFKSSISVLKSIAPIFIFIQVKPCFSFSEICCFIKLLSPIQISPFIGMAASPRENSEGNNSKGFFERKDLKAVSIPNCIEGNSCNASYKSASLTPSSTFSQTPASSSS